MADKVIAKTPKIEKETELKVRGRFLRIPPDKLRFAAMQVKNKEINQAIDILKFSKLSASRGLASVLKSGLSIANAKGIDGNLYIKTVAVDEGPKLKRRRIVHQGRATAILKRMSHISVYLSNTPIKKKKGKE